MSHLLPCPTSRRLPHLLGPFGTLGHGGEAHRQVKPTSCSARRAHGTVSPPSERNSICWRPWDWSSWRLGFSSYVWTKAKHLMRMRLLLTARNDMLLSAVLLLKSSPDERTDASQDNAQLIDVWVGSLLFHEQSVRRDPCCFKGSPRYLALSRAASWPLAGQASQTLR